MIDRTWNFIGSEGTVTEQGCRLNDGRCTAANGGQDTIKTSGCDSNERPVTVTYDKASYLGMDVGSNKSIVGKGNKGVFHGKGLRFKAGARNVIIQNIHIDNLNPKYVWGGDAISLSGNDGVWIDHVKVCLQEVVLCLKKILIVYNRSPGLEDSISSHSKSLWPCARPDKLTCPPATTLPA